MEHPLVPYLRAVKHIEDTFAHIRALNEHLTWTIPEDLQPQLARSKCRVPTDSLYGSPSGVTGLNAEKPPCMIEDVQPSPRRSTETEIMTASLRAVIDGGLHGILQQATKVRAVGRASAVMESMLERDERYYEWSLQDWADELHAGRQTIVKTPAWETIMQRRKANEARLASKVSCGLR